MTERERSPSQLHAMVAERLGLPLNELWTAHTRRNSRLKEGRREHVPAADSAVVELRFQAKGNAKRRLQRALAYHALDGETSVAGLICTRSALPFEFLTYTTVLAALLALQAGGSLRDWTFLRDP